MEDRKGFIQSEDWIVRVSRDNKPKPRQQKIPSGHPVRIDEGQGSQTPDTHPTGPRTIQGTQGRAGVEGCARSFFGRA